MMHPVNFQLLFIFPTHSDALVDIIGTACGVLRLSPPPFFFIWAANWAKHLGRPFLLSFWRDFFLADFTNGETRKGLY